MTRSNALATGAPSQGISAGDWNEALYLSRAIGSATTRRKPTASVTDVAKRGLGRPSRIQIASPMNRSGTT